MRKSDPVIKQSLKIVKLPIIRAEWTIEEDEDQKGGEEHAEFIKEALFGDKLNKSFLNLILSFLSISGILSRSDSKLLIFIINSFFSSVLSPR